MRMRSKSTEAEIGSRVNKVVEMILEGYSTSDILQYSADNWGVQERMTRDYISRAKEIISENQQINVREKMTVHNARLEMLLRKSFDKGDTRTTFEIAREIDAFNGLKQIRSAQQRDLWAIEKSNSDRPEDSTFSVLAAGF